MTQPCECDESLNGVANQVPWAKYCGADGLEWREQRVVTALCRRIALAGLALVWPLGGPELQAQQQAKPDTAIGPVQGAGGPSSVTQQVAEDNARRKVGSLKQATDWLRDKAGLNFGLDYNLTTQMVNESPGGTAAAGGVFRFYGHWAPVKRGTASNGSLVFKVENRHRLGTDLSPQFLGPTAGYAGVTAATFSDQGWILSNFYWQQNLFKNRLAFNVGLVDVTDYVDVYGLINVWSDFNNLAFATGSAAMPTPSQGLGAAIRWNMTPNFYLIGGLGDANGDPHRPGDLFTSFFDTSEFFWHAEAGWIGSWETRYSDNIHVSAWKADERVEAGVENGWGMAASISHPFGDRWQPFLRGGYADGGGAFVAKSVSAGTGYKLMDRGDLVGVGANWGRPPEATGGADPRDQYTIEAYYKTYQIPQMEVWPSFQFLINPALLPEKTTLWLISIRARVAL